MSLTDEPDFKRILVEYREVTKIYNDIFGLINSSIIEDSIRVCISIITDLEQSDFDLSSEYSQESIDLIESIREYTADKIKEIYKFAEEELTSEPPFKHHPME